MLPVPLDADPIGIVQAEEVEEGVVRHRDQRRIPTKVMMTSAGSTSSQALLS